MALVIEDGTGVDGANSYASADEAKAYATSRGLSFSDESAIEGLLVRAMDYIESKRARYRGSRVYSLQWPREGAACDGIELDADEIPGEVKLAQCQAALDLQAVDPHAATKGPAVKQKTVGPISTTYAITDGVQVPARMPKVDAFLAPLFKVGGGLAVERA